MSELRFLPGLTLPEICNSGFFFRLDRIDPRQIRTPPLCQSGFWTALSTYLVDLRNVVVQRRHDAFNAAG